MGDGLVGKACTAQARRPKFRVPAAAQKPGAVADITIFRMGKQGRWGRGDRDRDRKRELLKYFSSPTLRGKSLGN